MSRFDAERAYRELEERERRADVVESLVLVAFYIAFSAVLFWVTL